MDCDEHNGWTADVNEVLDKIRVNSIKLSNEHKKTYFIMASYIKWFRVPVIVFSAVGSVLGIGLSPYLTQLVISEICSIISMVVSLIGSLELFLAISTKMENELVHSKELYLLSIEIQKTLLLDYSHRNGNGMAYLEEKFGVYSKLIENSHLMECRIIDELAPLPNEFQSKLEEAISDSSPTTPHPIWRLLRRNHRESHKKKMNLDINYLKKVANKVKPAEPDENDSPLSIDEGPFYYNNVVRHDVPKDNDVVLSKRSRRTNASQHVPRPEGRSSNRKKEENTPSHGNGPGTPPGGDPLQLCEEGNARIIRINGAGERISEGPCENGEDASVQSSAPMVFLNDREEATINRLVRQVKHIDRSYLRPSSRAKLLQERSLHLVRKNRSMDTLGRRASLLRSALLNVGPLDAVAAAAAAPTPTGVDP